MGAIEAGNETQPFEMGDRSRGDRRGRCMRCEMRDRPGRRRTAKRAVRKLGVTFPMVMLVMRRVGRRQPVAAKFQRKRRTGRRHKSRRYIGTERERDQHDAGDQVTGTTLDGVALHIRRCCVPGTTFLDD